MDGCLTKVSRVSRKMDGYLTKLSRVRRKFAAEHREKLAARRAESNAEKMKQMDIAKAELEKFDAQRKLTMESTKKANASAEADFMALRDGALKAGMQGKDSWEKVTSYLDLTADPKRQNLVSRMKSVLIAVKSQPPATGKNFGVAA
ncbi:hypothetical protein T484DRAFT_3134218 [Baffinella frigidus]|nr:hypothetical protein T484DRAFT_3134218 [Cryptophyta sp. CCMP2293]